MSKIKEIIQDTKRKKALLFLAMPGVLFLLIFNYLPMFGIFIAFKSINFSKGIFKSDWVGFDNFKFFFKSGDFIRITRNTVLLNVLFISVTLLLSVILALMLFELGKKLVKLYQTILFYPYLLSWVVVSYIAYIFLNPGYGIVNNVLDKLGMNPVNWYAEPIYWPVILLVVTIWKSVGFSSLIYYTGLMGIDSSFYEAATIDGATRFQQTMKITIPLLSPLIAMMIILSAGRIFSADFGMFYFLTKNSSLLYSTTDVIDTYVYRTMRVSGEPGMSAAVSLSQSVVGFLMIIATNWLVSKISAEKALF